MRRTTEENLREREGLVLGQHGTGGVNRRIHRHAGGGLEQNPRGARPDERHAAGGVRTLLDRPACVKDEARFGVYNLRALRRGSEARFGMYNLRARRRGWLPVPAGRACSYRPA